ncbi:MAG: hypothetical protein IMZ61_15985 [Planctomycetes bacterium]|nr:hypothetical protein [Planctomycetota bacterium]
MTPIEFLKNILTDKYPDMASLKTDALSFYTQIIQSNQEEAVLSIPFSGQVLSIPAVYYNEALEFFQEGFKLKAMKNIRTKGWMGSDKTATPELKWAKEFVESFPKERAVHLQISDR